MSHFHKKAWTTEQRPLVENLLAVQSDFDSFTSIKRCFTKKIFFFYLIIVKYDIK